MKYFTNLIVFLAWDLEKISDINATTQDEQIRKLRLFKKWNFEFVCSPFVMITFKRNEPHYVLVVADSFIYVTYSENSYSENSTKSAVIEMSGIDQPSSIVEAPDGTFDVPSVTVTNDNKIYRLNMTDPLQPKLILFEDISNTENFISQVWINKNQFLAGYHDENLVYYLSHFEKKNKGEVKEWDKKNISTGEFYDMFLFQYEPKSFPVVYARRDTQIVIMWAEDAEGKPGDWQNEGHIRKSYINCKSNFITSADVNNDGKTDLLVSLERGKEVGGETKWFNEVRAYEIPHSDEFKNPDNYKEHTLISYPIDGVLTGEDDDDIYDFNVECIKQLKAFTPCASYKGKQWILVGEYSCGDASYLQPESDDAGAWSYKRIQFYTSDGTLNKFEVADINQDGYTELFIASSDKHEEMTNLIEYSFASIKDIVTDPPPIPLVKFNISSIPSSSSILYLDSTLPMFIGLAFPLRLL